MAAPDGLRKALEPVPAQLQRLEPGHVPDGLRDRPKVVVLQVQVLELRQPAYRAGQLKDFVVVQGFLLFRHA